MGWIFVSIVVALWLLLADDNNSFCHALTSSTSPSNNNNNKKIQVCQNKHCCKHYQGRASSLVQTIQDLTLACSSDGGGDNFQVKVEATGCLSECQHGPNLQIGDQKIAGVSNPAMAAVHLELALGRPTPKLLLAAVQVLEKAHGKPIEERLRLYDSVIAKLTSTNELNESSAVAHAYRARAKYHLDVNEYELARQDALEAIRIRSGSAVDSLLKTELKVYRLLADAEEALGNFDGAVEAYREWKQLDPPSGTKLNGEIQRLLQHIHAEQSNSNSC